jgi:phosphopentomutase
VLRDGDICLITADHGNDPTWRGTDHTREQAPIIGFGPAAPIGSVGRRETFADTGASIAAHLGVDAPEQGKAFLPDYPREAAIIASASAGLIRPS